MNNRLARRVATIAAGTLVSLLATAGSALANASDDGEVHGPSLGLGDTLLLFVVIPIGAFLVISGLSLLPSTLRRPRYRPGREWDREPVWVGGPHASTQADEPTARGGASAEW